MYVFLFKKKKKHQIPGNIALRITQEATGGSSK